MTWHPVLGASLRAEAIEAARAIAEDLRTPDAVPTADSNPASLPGGYAGLAVFFSYLARSCDGDKGYQAISGDYLDRAIAAVRDLPMNDALHGGFTGIAWTVQHLSSPVDRDDMFDEIDEALTGRLQQSPWPGEYDLVGGLVGLGIYGLERLPAAGGRRVVELAVERLEEISSSSSGHGLTWHTKPAFLPPHQLETHPSGCYNFGLAHGIPGIIGFLAAASASGIARETARSMLTESVGWLLGQQQPGTFDSAFPWGKVPGDEPTECRAAWCYGDPGVAAALAMASRAMGDESWGRVAYRIAARAARRDPESCGVLDAGLCHGASGLALIFQRLRCAGGPVELEEAARSWAQRTLEMREPGKGVGGYQAHFPDAEAGREWQAEPGLLTGAAGVGLALLAAATEIEPAWDRALMLSTAS